MAISVVIATYNGEKYIIEQLESIKNQTMAPDEVIILDDCSSDNTAEKVKSFIQLYDLFNWKLVMNAGNQGWKKNFTKGFDMATGDYVFPCDQDDIWHENKIELTVRALEEAPEYELLATNYKVFYEGKGNKNYSRNTKEMEKMDQGSIERVSLDKYWLHVTRPGCSMCFRKKFYNEIRKYWRDDWPHDANLWRFAAVRGTLGIFAVPTFEFRRHADSATSQDGYGKNTRAKNCQYYVEVVEFFRKYMEENGLLTSKKDRLLTTIACFHKCREKFLSSPDINTLFQIVFFYHSYYLTGRAFLGDLLFAIKD